MPPVILGPRCNRRATCSPSPNNARSESAIAVNPLDPYNMVGASKRFTNPSIYAFSLAAYATFDGGLSWIEAPPLTLLPGWAGASDPAVAWDNMGNAYVVALPFGPGTATDYTGDTIGIAVYKSSDGGRTWGSPTLIHSSSGDDKQWATGDGNPASPYYGNVYAAWDDGSQLRFARTTDHGATWKGIGAQPAGSVLASDSFSPEISVAADGTVYIVWLNGQSGSQIKFVKSTDGGNTFSASQIAASGITSLRGALPEIDGWPHFPGATFRVLTLATGCTGLGNNVIFAWADYREGKSRIYYRRSTNGGSTWEGSGSGDPLLTGAVASSSNMQDFHPQLISTPTGEIGCAFYQYGPKGSGEFPPNRIDVILAVSTDNGATFPNRVTATEQAWDPTVDAPAVHGNPAVTFIGEYFGLDASRMGFFPFWTDTRTGVQEMFAARISVNPADIYIRDSSSDTGNVPSPGNSWEAPDLIVRRQPDGDSDFTNQDLLRDGVTDHYVYARVTNKGPNTARNVRLAVTVGNYPSLIGLPGAEFRYPQDWYKKDWNTPALEANHLFLGESTPITIPSGDTRLIGPVVWPAAQIPSPTSWHPCLLAEVRADNNDSAGGTYGCDIQVDPGTCNYGAYFWGNNNVCQRNLSYATVLAGTAAYLELSFLVGSVWNHSQLLEVIVDKQPELAAVPMTLLMEPIRIPDEPTQHVCPFLEQLKFFVRMVEEYLASLLGISCPAKNQPGYQRWRLTESQAAVSFAIASGELRQMTLSFITPTTLQRGTRPTIRIFQRNDRSVTTGSVQLELEVL